MLAHIIGFDAKSSTALSKCQAGDVPRSYYQGRKSDPSLLPERQGNSDLRTNPGEEDMDIGYEDKPMLEIFEGLEQKFLDEILKLAKEQNDAEDAENAGHRELQEKELLLQSKEDSIKEQLQKNLDLEGKLKEAKSVAEELREAAKNVVEEHSTEIWKHKTALIELVSNQRQLEAEMGRVSDKLKQLNKTLTQFQRRRNNLSR